MNRRVFLIFSYTILILGAFSMLFPFFWMFSASFMSSTQILSGVVNFLPKPFVFQNYIDITQKIPIVQYFLNSLFVAVLTTVGQVIFSAFAGYSFARMNFKGKDFLFFVFLVTMMIPPQVNIIPLFFLMKELSWIDTYQALVVPGLFGGFGVFLMRQWFKGLPKSLEDAAKIDGCNYFQTFFKIALPLGMPALATLSIFTFITSWNSFMWPLIVTNSDRMRTLPVGLAVFKGSFRETTEWGQLMACAVIAIIPVIAVFLAGQKYFIKGLMAGAIKE
ncbi:MAG: carbohydrate ABC transporter permease [bacterium]